MGTIMIADVNNFFGSFLRYNKLNNFEMVCIGKDVISDITKDDEYSRAGKGAYTSRYNHVSFCRHLNPSPYVENLSYDNPNGNKFVQAYHRQLQDSKESVCSMCAIVDMAINRNINVILLISNREYNMGYWVALRDFFDLMFGVEIISCEDYLVDPTNIKVYDCDESIQQKLVYYLREYNIIGKTEDASNFINQFVDDEGQKLTEELMKKSVNELVELGKRYDLYVNRFKPKEEIVDTLLMKLLMK